MKSFAIWQLKNGYLLHPTNYPKLERKEVIIKAKSRLEALKAFSEGYINYNGTQPYLMVGDIKYVAFLKKP
jgi:hypothetical protein